MKNLKLVTLTLMVCLLTLTSIFAQNKTFDDVLSVRLRNSGVITDNKEIKGYYFFYTKDKVNRKMNSYLLRILDQNLTEIGQKEITQSKHISLLEGTYNGQKIMLKFYDTKTREISYKSFDKSAELDNEETTPLSKTEGNMLAQAASMETAARPNSLFSISDKGFVDYIFRKNKTYGYEVRFLPSDGSKGWTYQTDPTSKIIEAGGFLHADDNIILSTVSSRKRLMSMKGAKSFVRANSLIDGKKLWDTEIIDDQYELSLLNSYVDKDKKQIALFGSYFKKGANVQKAKSLGLFSFVVDNTSGEIITKNYISWVEDAGQFLEISDKGKIKSSGYVFFHEFVKTADGRIFGIGEQYRKAINAGGIARDVAAGVAVGLLAAATGANAEVGAGSAHKFVVEDFYIFEFNQDFSLKDIKVFEKGKSSIELPGITVSSPSELALYMKAMGQFDYYFTQEDDNGEVLHIGYLDYDRTQKKNEKNYFGTITYVDGEFTSDRIPLVRKKKTSIYVLPAKPGHVMIIEYNRKEKTMDTRLEAINF